MTVSEARKAKSVEAHKAYSLAAMPPQAYDKYSLIGKLGHGGMAEVNLAVVEGKGGFRKLTVIKRLHRHLAMEPGFIEMFLDEARLAARLNHPHCVQTYEVGEVDDNHFLAMEYLDGQGLERLLRISGQLGEKMPIPLSARIIADALDGLAYAHELTDFDGSELGVVHRDVSPQNIFVTYNGMVKLLDFGIAKAATHVVETKTGVIKGKYAYIAPEQALGQSVDQRSDLWSMGVVLWEVLTGRRLFKSVNELATLHETLQGEIKLPSAFRPELPTELDTICNRALQRDPNERYQTAQEMKDDLERYLRSFPDSPGRRQIGHLMKDRFAAVIKHHKRTLQQCLQGSGSGTETIQRLIPPNSSSSQEMLTPSHSGVIAHGTPTPTPAPMLNPASVTPPPASVAGHPASGQYASVPPGPQQSSMGWVWKAAIVVGVILLALVLGLLLPLGDDDEPIADVGTTEVVDRPGGQPEGVPVIETPTPTDPGEATGTAPIVIAPVPMDTVEPGENVNPDENTDVDLGLAPDPVDPSTDDPDEGTPGQPAVPVRASAAVRARLAAARRARREQAAREQAQRELEQAPADPPPPRPVARESGFLTLATNPWTNVMFNGRNLGTTPLIRVSLPAGTHTLRLVNEEQGINRTYRVTIEAGELLTRRVGL